MGLLAGDRAEVDRRMGLTSAFERYRHSEGVLARSFLIHTGFIYIAEGS